MSVSCSSYDLRCPYCQKIASHAVFPYTRMIISTGPDGRLETFSEVPRFRCGSCRRTFSLLPEGCLPEGSYTYEFIQAVLAEYRSRRYSVRSLCEKWQISPSTLYGWKARYLPATIP